MPFDLPTDKVPGNKVYASDFNLHTRALRILMQAAATRGSGISVGVDKGGLNIGDYKARAGVRNPPLLLMGWNVGDVALRATDACAITWPMPEQYARVYEGQPYTGGTDNDEARYRRDLVCEIRLPHCGHFGRFGICAERIEPGHVGWFYAAGTVLTWITRDPGGNGVNVQDIDEADRADTIRNSPTLTLGPVGAARVLWMEDADDPADFGPHNCVIEFGERNSHGVGISSIDPHAHDGDAEVIQFPEGFTLSYAGDGPGRVVIDYTAPGGGS